MGRDVLWPETPPVFNPWGEAATKPTTAGGVVWMASSLVLWFAAAADIFW